MSNTNVVVISGNLGADVESSATGGGTMVANIRIAVNKHSPDGQGGFNTKTSWVSVKSFGPIAERMIGKLSKGSKVIITGELEEEVWKDKQSGANRSKLVVIANSYESLSGAANAKQNQGQFAQQNSQKQGRQNNGGQNNGYQQQPKPQQDQSRPAGY